MKVKYTTKVNRFPDMKTAIEALGKKSVEVGAIKGEHAWLAGIHEYGATITPKNAQYLTVPTHPDAVGRKARDFPDLWTLRADSGELFLCRNKGKDEFEVMYWLTKSVTIPERSFLRKSHDENGEDVLKSCERALGQVLGGQMSMEQYLKMLGEQYQGMVQDYIRDLRDPPNSPITVENKGSDNPLVDTGNLIESISFRIT